MIENLVYVPGDLLKILFKSLPEQRLQDLDVYGEIVEICGIEVYRGKCFYKYKFLENSKVTKQIQGLRFWGVVFSSFTLEEGQFGLVKLYKKREDPYPEPKYNLGDIVTMKSSFSRSPMKGIEYIGDVKIIHLMKNDIIYSVNIKPELNSSEINNIIREKRVPSAIGYEKDVRYLWENKQQFGYERI